MADPNPRFATVQAFWSSLDIQLTDSDWSEFSSAYKSSSRDNNPNENISS